MAEYTIADGNARSLPDIESFIETVNRLEDHPTREAHGLFDGVSEVHVGRAPGRLDVMGGIADYSGSLVLQLPIREATIVGLQRSSDTTLRVVSGDADENARLPDFEIHVSNLVHDDRPICLRELSCEDIRGAAHDDGGKLADRAVGRVDVSVARELHDVRA